jgi:hypothetical protein
MDGGRYVVLALTQQDPTWLDGLPGVEVVHCTGVDEASVALAGSRPWSALVIDGRPGVGTQDLVSLARRASVPVLVTAAPVGPPGALLVRRLPGELLAALGRWTSPIPWAGNVLGRWEGPTTSPVGAGWRPSSSRAADSGPGGLAPGARPCLAGSPAGAGSAPVGRLVVVCGPGGTGASTVAMGLAAGLGRFQPGALLADLALRAGQAVLHGIHRPARTVDDLAHAHGMRPLDGPGVGDFTLAVAGRPYRLLAGLRHRRHWTAIRPLAFNAALDALLTAFPLIVADVTGDFEGENDTGSLDVEERNHMARHAASAADLVVLVGSHGPTGRRALDETAEAVAARGVTPDRLLTVVNRTSVTDRPGALALPHLRVNDDPATWSSPVARIVASLLDKRPPRGEVSPDLVPVLPGSIGHW